jgi:hypothetical protein
MASFVEVSIATAISNALSSESSLIDLFYNGLFVIIPVVKHQRIRMNMWCPEFVPEGFPDVQLREFKCYILNDNFKTPAARAKVIGTLNHI